ncbi:hypothetical protein H0H93_003343 [Arthromyces matolae]|nr:hypothetical protein H0H93_003343 [Arthromyces matolae]
MPIYPIHAPGETYNLPVLGDITCVIPIGGEAPPIPGPQRKAAELTPTYTSSLFGHQSGAAFELGNDPADIIAGAVHLHEGVISGLELRFFGRPPPGVGGSLGDRAEFTLSNDEYISGIEGTTDGKHITSLTFLTNKRNLPHGTANGSHFSWHASNEQTIVGLSGFADDFISGLAVIYLDAKDDPPYDPSKDANIEIRPTRDILPPEMQKLFHNSDLTSLNERQTKFNDNMHTVYGSITDVLNDGMNPWGQYTHQASGKHFLLHLDAQSKSYVYIFANQQPSSKGDDSAPGDQTSSEGHAPPPSDQSNVTIGHYSGHAAWTDTVNYITRGVIDPTVFMGVMWAFGKWFGSYLLRKGEQFVNNALDELAVALVEQNVMQQAGRMFARVAVGVFQRTFKLGIRILGAFIAALIGWGVDALIEFIFKSYYLNVRIYNHDARFVDWTPTGYWGYNEEIANGEWASVHVPQIIDVQTQEWLPEVGWVTHDNYVGSYNSYIWTNEKPAAGVAVALTVERPGTSESINLMYWVAKAAKNSMGLDWGKEDNKTYLNSGKDQQVTQLSFDKPLKVSGLSPALKGVANGAYEYTIVIGTLPPPKG